MFIANAPRKQKKLKYTKSNEIMPHSSKPNNEEYTGIETAFMLNPIAAIINTKNEDFNFDFVNLAIVFQLLELFIP
jgi:hypothetical protein